MDKTEYAFFDIENNWYIIEKVPEYNNKYFQDKLMINKNGTVYIIKQWKADKDNAARKVL